MQQSEGEGEGEEEEEEKELSHHTMNTAEQETQEILALLESNPGLLFDTRSSAIIQVQIDEKIDENQDITYDHNIEGMNLADHINFLQQNVGNILQVEQQYIAENFSSFFTQEEEKEDEEKED